MVHILQKEPRRTSLAEYAKDENWNQIKSSNSWSRAPSFNTVKVTSVALKDKKKKRLTVTLSLDVCERLGWQDTERVYVFDHGTNQFIYMIVPRVGDEQNKKTSYKLSHERKKGVVKKVKVSFQIESLALTTFNATDVDFEVVGERLVFQIPAALLT